MAMGDLTRGQHGFQVIEPSSSHMDNGLMKLIHYA
jgi:hypothetical protein